MAAPDASFCSRHAKLISARRAAVLAYISSLLLRTHTAIDADREAGVRNPRLSPREASQVNASAGDASSKDVWSGPNPDPNKKPS